jgi:hypothetical protein
LTDSQLQTIEFRPGINANVTEYRAGDSAGWTDGDKIRFLDGRAQKIGGWSANSTKQSEDPNISQLLCGTARDINTWSDLNSQQYVAIAGDCKVELVADNTIYDITPTKQEYRLAGVPGPDDDSRYLQIANNVIDTFIGDTKVRINLPSADISVGDYVYINSQEFPVAGITLEGTYEVIDVEDAPFSWFEVDSGVVAATTETGQGGELAIDILLECGQQSNSRIIGYGGGTWNTPGQLLPPTFPDGGYGGPRAGGEAGAALRQWSLDNWGEDLLACVSGGEIYHWDASRTSPRERRLQTLENRIKENDPENGFYEPDPVIRQELVDAYPRKNLFCLVALPARIVVAFGSNLAVGGDFDPLVIRWSDIESLTDWRIKKTNSAGEYRLPKGNRIVAAHQTRTEIIVFTDEEAYSMVFVGGNEVFRFTPLGTNMSATGIHAVIDVNGIVYWMGVDDFYMYDGTIRPMPNSIDDLLFDQDGEARLDQKQKEKVFAGVNKKFHEIWWFYPIESTDINFPAEVDMNNYVVYNYMENAWYYGTMQRSVWSDRGTFGRPLAVGRDTQTDEVRLFSHEQGKDDNGVALYSFIESGFFDIAEGTDFVFIDRILPDLELPGTSTCKITIKTKRYPHPNAQIIEKGPYTFSDLDNKISMRARGRQVSIRYEVDGEGQDFEIGKVRLGLRTDGRR